MPTDDLYPGFHILDQRGHWDEATRKVVLDRVEHVPPFRHFNPHQQGTLQALCDRVMPQSFRAPEQRIPIAPWIDLSCSQGSTEGYRFDNMPTNSVAWDWGLDGLDQTAQALFQAPFVVLNGERQDQVLQSIRGGSPPGEVWQRMPARRWWIYVALRQITGVYYAHPTAWDEIGFGGPAYPRGYFALNFGEPEPWEVEEKPDDQKGTAA
jgi:hypothetical protein